MSTPQAGPLDDAAAFQDFIAYWQSVDIAITLEVAATALFVYDYFLTLPREIKHIWSRKKTTATLLFVLNRYVVMFNRGFRMIQAVSWQGQFEHTADRHLDRPILFSCNVVWRFSESCTITMYLVVAFFAAIRMYAVWGADRKVFGCVLALGLIYPIVNTYYVTTLVFSAFPPPLTGCGQHSNLTFPDINSDEFFFIFGTIFSILFESVVIALTWVKTADIQRNLRVANPHFPRQGVSYLILRDGTTYFVTLLFLNVLSMLSIRIEAFNNMPALIDTLTSMLISRFILDLRGEHNFGQDSTDSSFRLSKLTELRFASQPTSSFVGPLGGQLHVEGDMEDRDDEHSSSHGSYSETTGTTAVSGYQSWKAMDGGSRRAQLV